MFPVLSIGSYLLLQILTVLLVGWCIYGYRLRKREAGFGIRTAVFLILYLAVAILPIAGAMLPDSRFKFALQAAGNIWLGFFGYFFGIMLILCIFLGIWCAVCSKDTPKLRRAVLVLSAAAAAVLWVYGMIHAQKTIVKQYDVTVEKSAGDLKDLKVVLIADLHMCVNSHLSMIERVVDLTNEQQPDVVLVGGDIFTSSYGGLKDPEKYAAALSKIEAKYGVFAVYGNHDVEETLFGGFPISPISEAFRTPEMEQFFKDCNFTVLYDETVLIADDMVQLTGRVDGEKAGDGTADRKSAKEVLADADLSKPVIVLEHEPVEYEELKESGADLVLSGHTHAGQIFPGNLIIPFFNENAYGYRVVSGLDTIVTSGIGYYGPPMRVGTNSEVTVVNIHFQGE